MKQIDLNRIKLRSIADRKSKVNKSQFSLKVSHKGVSNFVESLPDILKGADLKALISAIMNAHSKDKPVIWMFGAHVIKVGLSPLFCEMVSSGFAQQLSTNNAGLIHDMELAFFGVTSEDVEESLKRGDFGMTRETGNLYQQLCDLADDQGIGLGEAAGKFIVEKKAKYVSTSVFATAYRAKIPITVHAAIGTDIVNAHPGYDGAKVGAASQIDFRIFCETVCQLKNGGVAINVGSAVIMPEVFLKAIAIARNLDPKFTKFVSANFDMIGLYRPSNNIVKRPRLLGATAYEFTGHHEIMMPLLWAAIKDRLNIKI